MKIIFMGTPQFAVPILEKIATAHEIILVVTQPDTFIRNKKKWLYSPVKTWALAQDLPVFQPEKIKDEAARILQEEVDLIVTAAYGQFIPKVLLEHPRHKAINVHGSLLPKYRGGAPIQRALINGDTKTGITIMYMSPKMDAGDIISQREIEILKSDNQDRLFERLSQLGSEMILPAIEEIEKGTVRPLPQDPSEVSFAYNLTKDDELLDFSRPALEVHNRIRGLCSNPGAYFRLDDLEIKVFDSCVGVTTDMPPGRIVAIQKDYFAVSCGDGKTLQITEIQLPSKKRISVRDFFNGTGRNIIEKNKEINK
ncbi:MAG: methionyl-tRNA formyltransferase [Acholeplasmataceae bacterium]|mgnify:CR=1 FL=1|jgi:methionyl-tRNA formyltransferase|nr:methionyl-tRNA formyltransferase [Acholeplasmataceae bacterium]